MKLLLFNTNLAARSVLSYAESGEKLIVLTDQKGIYELMSLLDYQNVQLHFISAGYSLSQPSRLFKAKSSIRLLFNENKIDEVVFYHQAFGGFYNWIIWYAHQKHIPILYQRCVKPLETGQPDHSLRAIKHYLTYKLCYHTDVAMYTNGTKGTTPRLTDKFRKDNGVFEQWVFWKDENVKTSGKRVAEKLSLPPIKGKVLLLSGSVVATGAVESSVYENKMKELITAIGADEIICKCHPRFSDETEEEKVLPHIPAYIPMELLLQQFKVVIGYGSSVLLNAADNGQIAISLVDYLPEKSALRKDVFYDYFKGSKVIFIRSSQELLNIIYR